MKCKICHKGNIQYSYDALLHAYCKECINCKWVQIITKDEYDFEQELIKEDIINDK